VIDDAARPKVPVEGHLDDDLSLARELLGQDRPGAFVGMSVGGPALPSAHRCGARALTPVDVRPASSVLTSPQQTLYRPKSVTNSHVKAIGAMPAANIKGMTEGSDPPTAPSEVAVGGVALLSYFTGSLGTLNVERHRHRRPLVGEPVRVPPRGS
jgi:hypothetical protein